jgi:prephenate dehydrogenase
MTEHIVCSFVGLGLIGGSLAKALKQGKNDLKIQIYDTDEATRSLALSQGTADAVFSDYTPEFLHCDYLFLCAPVTVNLSCLESICPGLNDNCIISDVGSVKGPIHEKVRCLGLSPRFIGGHPMAGSERFGFANSQASLLENAYYVLTPEPEVDRKKVDDFYQLIQLTGAIPYVLDVDRHDQATAAISHLPHLIAAALVNLIRQEDDHSATLKTLAAGGFKDITRIASSSPRLWQQICMENRENILQLLARYIDSLNRLYEELSEEDQDYLLDFFSSARAYRDSFMDTGSGPLMKQYVLTLDIPDKSGSLAKVAALLASCSISIKNIGIVHNREYQEGVLRMEFYRRQEYENAIDILRKEGYPVHQ